MIPPGVNVAEADTATDGRASMRAFQWMSWARNALMAASIVREGVKPLPEHDFPGAFPDGERAAVRLGPEERGSEQDAEIVGIGQAVPVPCDPVQDDGIAVPLDGHVVLPVETQGAAAFVESQFEPAGFSEIFNK